VLQVHGKYLARTAQEMLIQGNCDERGSREYNIALGNAGRRVKRMLVLMGATNPVEPVTWARKTRCAITTKDAGRRTAQRHPLRGEY